MFIRKCYTLGKDEQFGRSPLKDQHTSMKE